MVKRTPALWKHCIVTDNSQEYHGILAISYVHIAAKMKTCQNQPGRRDETNPPAHRTKSLTSLAGEVLWKSKTRRASEDEEENLAT